MALPAKLNLFLYITGRREDGYHLLQTLFQFLDYGDTLTIDPRQDDRIHLLTPVDGVPDEQNLIVRAARLLQRYCDERGLQTAPRGADISIDKHLPMGGGLGGGSTPPPCWWRSTNCGAAVLATTNWQRWGSASAPTCRCSCAATPPSPKASASACSRPSRRKSGIWWRIPASASRRRLSSVTPN